MQDPIKLCTRRKVALALLTVGALVAGCTLRQSAHKLAEHTEFNSYRNVFCSPFSLDRTGISGEGGPSVSPMRAEEVRVGFVNRYTFGDWPFPCERRESTTMRAFAKWEVPARSLRRREDVVRAQLRAIVRDRGIPITSQALMEPGGMVLGVDGLGCFFDLHVVSEAWNVRFTDAGLPLVEGTRVPRSTVVPDSRVQFHAHTRELRWDVTEIVRDWAVSGTTNEGIAIVPAPHFINKNKNDTCIATFSDVEIEAELREE